MPNASMNTMTAGHGGAPSGVKTWQSMRPSAVSTSIRVTEMQYGESAAIVYPQIIHGATRCDRRALARTRHACPRSRAAADVCHHFPPGRGENDAHGEAAALCGGDRTRGSRPRPEDRPPRDVRLDGDRAAAWHLDQRRGARVRAEGAPRHPARHAGDRKSTRLNSSH